MITQIKGKLVEKNPTQVVVDCNGIGYEINISLFTFSSLSSDENIKLFTHLQVREDAHILFGFSEEEERMMFRELINVSGVGASTALMVLSSMKPGEVARAVDQSDVNAFKSVKGIGLKSAQFLCGLWRFCVLHHLFHVQISRVRFCLVAAAAEAMNYFVI